MAVKYRIEYCNKESDTARLDIDVRDYAGQIYPIEGTGDLFILEYKRSDDYFLTTIADIQIFSDANFNIDGLKTSDETELKAFFYVNNVLKWQGYILPDFFQTGITGTDAISMTATDRLSVLKDVPLDYSLDKLSYIQLITECLAKTGLSMNCNVVADFMLDGMPSTFHIMNCYVDHSRITNRNKSLSAYDTLRSVLVLLNAQIVQWAGEWWIVNRYQMRNGGGRVYNYTTSGIFNTSGTFTPASIPFGMVEANGRRSIEPVASQTSVFMEFGGVRRYPDDYEFRTYNNGYNGWTAVNGFTYTVSAKELLGYTSANVAIEGSRDVRARMVQANAAPTFYDKTVDLTGAPYLKSTPLVNKIEGKINVDVNVSATGVNGGGLPFIILIDNKRTDDAKERYYVYGKNGIEKLPATNITAYINKTGVQDILFYDENLPATAAISASTKLNFTINSVDVGVASFIGTEFTILIYGTSISGTIKTYVEEASIGISNAIDGKGILYRTEQGSGSYSKKDEADTTIFGDHLTQGINGYFYAYPQDELSIHSYFGANIRIGWTSPDDAQVDPILLHSVRQRARTNSVAKNILNVNISETFNPLAIYTCNATSYVVRSARHDFLRTRTSVELEENASQNLLKKDYIYTYFGDEKEKGISSLAGISGGGSTGGGASHMHSNKDIIDQLSQLNLDVLALLEVDDNDNLKVSTNLYSTGSVSAYGIGTGGGGGTGSTVTWGTEAAGAVPLTVEGITKTLSLASHIHSGYLTAETDPTVPAHVKAITTGDITNWNSYSSSAHSHSNKSTLDAITAAYTTEEKSKLTGIAAGAEVNVQSDWNAISGDAQILNKPTSMPASDVSAWAKAATKPSYEWSEIGDKPALNYLSLLGGTVGGIINTTAWYEVNGQKAISGNEMGLYLGVNSTTMYIEASALFYSHPTLGAGNIWNFTNFNPALKLDASAYTAADVLTKLKTVDGHSSELDADTVDGYHVIASGHWDKIPIIEANYGVMEIGAHLDFHETAAGEEDYSGRLSCIDGSPLWSGNTMYHSLNANRTDVNWAAATLTAQTDILTPFNTWSNATDKNSMKKFLNLFDIDTEGNLVVKTNLYSTGEVTAYSAGTGVSGLTLQGDMNANGKNITNLLSVSNQQSMITIGYGSISFDILGSNLFIINDDGVYANTNIEASGTAQATEFKFGSWTFKQDGIGRLGIYNGTTEVACFNTDGTYVNLPA